MTGATVTRHYSGSVSVSVSGMVTDARDAWLCTLRMVETDGIITDAEAARAWREHVAGIGAWPV